jgi:mannan endo-1,4-beta-mannosidase
VRGTLPPAAVRHLCSSVLLGVVAAATAGCASGPADPSVANRSGTAIREFGVVVDPWHVDEWAEAVGAQPTMVMKFEQWHSARMLDEQFAEAGARGLTSFMVTWEPWEPVPAELGQDQQFADQPTYNNAAIAAGDHDSYIRDFARSVAAADLNVYIRYAHEMNGDWYPWSRDPDNYVRAWRRVVDIFRSVGATNARFVFSPNPSLYLAPERWVEVTEAYWPGEDYVDLIGPTVVRFAGEGNDYSVVDFAERLALMRDTFGLDLVISELNTAFEGRIEWLTDLRTWLATEADWVVGVVLSQPDESRGQIQRGFQVGDMSWSVTTDPATQPVIQGLIEDLTEPGSA